MFSLRKACAAVAVSAVLALSACSGATDDKSASSDSSKQPVGSAPASVTAKAPSVGGTLKGGAVCDLISLQDMSGQLGKPVLKATDLNLDMKTGTQVHDRDVCSYSLDVMAHIIIVQRVKGLDDTAWKNQKAAVESGKLAGSKKVPGLGDDALDLGDAFYMVRVGNVVIRVQDLHQDAKTVNDALVTWAVGRLT